MTTLKGGITYYKHRDRDEIKFHEELKQASIYAYTGAEADLPKGYSYVDEVHNTSGMDAYIIQKDNTVVLTFRGSQSLKDWEANIANYFGNPSKQAKEAYELTQELQAICEESGLGLIITGHSLGGGIGSYSAAKLGLPAVVFNPIGTADLIKSGEEFDDSNIVNYCVPRDWTPSGNDKGLFGKVYEVKPKGFTYSKESAWRAYHEAEAMDSLETRKESSKEEIRRKYKEYEQLDKNKKKQKKENITTTDCVGSYSVSGYTRSDGTKVDSYIRTCGAKHASSWRGKSFDKMSASEVDQMLEELI